MKLSVVIVNYNVKHYLAQCLHSLYKASLGIDMEVFVVDNKSTDGSIEFLKKLYPQVNYIENEKNVGFARANNQAIALSTGEYVLLLNPDTFVGENSMRDSIAFMDSNDEIGAMGVQMLRIDGSFAMESRRGIPTPFTSFCKMTGLCKMFPTSKVFGRYYMQYLDHEQATPIEIISGACMFLRRDALEKSGFLDEDFFMYGEDIDLSYRLLSSGYKNYYLPTRILHYKGESTQKSSFRYVYVFYQAMLIFFRKHYGHYSLFLSIPIKMAIYFKAVCSYVTQQMKKTSKKVCSPLEYVSSKSFLLIGSKEGVKSMENIANRHSIKYNKIVVDDDDDLLVNGHINMVDVAGKYDYIAYDTDIFSYSDILYFFSESSKWKSSPLIATYSSLTNCIITNVAVIE